MLELVNLYIFLFLFFHFNPFLATSGQSQKQAEKHTSTAMWPDDTYYSIANLLSNSCQLEYPANTRQHYHHTGVMFLSHIQFALSLFWSSPEKHLSHQLLKTHQPKDSDFTLTYTVTYVM